MQAWGSCLRSTISAPARDSFGYLNICRCGWVKNLERDVIDKAMTETINRIGHIMVMTKHIQTFSDRNP